MISRSVRVWGVLCHILAAVGAAFLILAISWALGIVGFVKLTPYDHDPVVTIRGVDGPIIVANGGATYAIERFLAERPIYESYLANGSEMYIRDLGGGTQLLYTADPVNFDPEYHFRLVLVPFLVRQETVYFRPIALVSEKRETQEAVHPRP